MNLSSISRMAALPPFLFFFFTTLFFSFFSLSLLTPSTSFGPPLGLSPPVFLFLFLLFRLTLIFLHQPLPSSSKTNSLKFPFDSSLLLFSSPSRSSLSFIGSTFPSHPSISFPSFSLSSFCLPSSSVSHSFPVFFCEFLSQSWWNEERHRIVCSLTLSDGAGSSVCYAVQGSQKTGYKCADLRCLGADLFLLPPAQIPQPALHRHICAGKVQRWGST